jgi:hypothetical protein
MTILYHIWALQHNWWASPKVEIAVIRKLFLKRTRAKWIVTKHYTIVYMYLISRNLIVPSSGLLGSSCIMSICSFFYLLFLITPVVSFGHCIVCTIYSFWLLMWYLLAIVLSAWFTYNGHKIPHELSEVVNRVDNTMATRYHRSNQLLLWYPVAILLSARFTTSDCSCGILWPLYCLHDLQLLITPVVSCGHCIVCTIDSFWLLLSMATRYHRSNQKL